MGARYSFRCIHCGAAAEAPVSAGTCASCNDPFCTLEMVFDLEQAGRTLTAESLASRPGNHWRYRELLPIDPDARAFGWPVGFTPMTEAARLGEWAGLVDEAGGRLRVKDDSRNPTLSFKDRASSVGVLHAMQSGATHIACASTGNAASSLAGYAAMAGIGATIFVPERAPKAKVAQLLLYGARVNRVMGSYAQAYELCNAQCAEHGWYNRNCAINPYLVEGKKTCGLEIAEQTAGDPADWVVVSVGDGCTIAGVVKGLREMHEIGLSPRVPRVLGVQPMGIDPIALAFESGALAVGVMEGGVGGSTMADSIDVPVPRNWRKAVKEVGLVDGAFVRVRDAEIVEAMRATGSMAGVLAEPAAAAAFAGLKNAVREGVVERGANVVAIVTGNGLKDMDAALEVAGDPVDVEPLPAG